MIKYNERNKADAFCGKNGKKVTKKIISIMISAVILVSCLMIFASCGNDEVLASFDGGDVRMSEVKPLLEAVEEVEGCEEGSEKYQAFYDEFVGNLLYAKLYEKEHSDYKFSYSDEIFESYLKAFEQNTLEQYNMGLRKYANAIGQTLAYFKAYTRLSLYKGAITDLEETAAEYVEGDTALYEEYLRSIYDADTSKYIRKASCDGYFLMIDSRGDDEESKKAVYDEIMTYVQRLDDGEDFFDLVYEVQTKYPDGILSLFENGFILNDIEYGKDYPYYVGTREIIWKELIKLEEGEYTKTPIEMYTVESEETDEETGETAVTPSKFMGYCIVMAKDVSKTDRPATFEDAKKQIESELPSEYLADLGAFYKEKISAKHNAKIG
ncbi:MAG: hypothetical protein J5940_02025 [Clostridia bacterium]|nr:hypothetical protein [Clostridia bacterium]